MAEAKSRYRLLFVGDVCGSPGRKMLEDTLAKIQWEHDVDFTIVNGENATGGRGMNAKTYQLFQDLGVDAVTMGNHTWDNKDILNFIEQAPTMVRPLNYPPNSPGVGWRVLPMGGLQVGVLNLIGRTYMNNVVADCPFQAALDALAELKKQTPIIFVDFHAEATSEKIALGRFLEGKVTGVFGTHTHVQTNDYRVLPQGTAYITDAGMTGPQDSVLGMEIEPIIQKFRSGMPVRFTVAEGNLQLNGVLVDFTAAGKALSIEPVNAYQEGL